MRKNLILLCAHHLATIIPRAKWCTPKTIYIYRLHILKALMYIDHTSCLRMHRTFGVCGPIWSFFTGEAMIDRALHMTCKSWTLAGWPSGLPVPLCICMVCTARGAGIACWLERRTRDRKVASSNPGRSGGRRIFFSRVDFVCWLLFGVRSTPVLPQ